MTQLIIIDSDGHQRTGSNYDSQMVSRIDDRQAVETWQVGYVRGDLAVRFKTVSAVNALLRQAAEGDRVEITYKRRLGIGQITEVLAVGHAGFGLQPLLNPVETPALSDKEIVALLNAAWGEYLTVTYRLVSTEAAETVPSRNPFIRFQLPEPPLVVAHGC